MTCPESLRNQKHTHTRLGPAGMLKIINMTSQHACLSQSTLHTLGIIRMKTKCLSSNHMALRLCSLPTSPGSFLATPPCTFQVLSLTCYRRTNVHICLQHADFPMSSPTYPSLLRTPIHPSKPTLRISFQDVFPSIKSPVPSLYSCGTLFSAVIVLFIGCLFFIFSTNCCSLTARAVCFIPASRDQHSD